MIMPAWLMRCSSQGHHTPGLAGEDGKHTSEDLISADSCLLRREGGKGIPDLHGLVVRVATRLGVVTGGIHEGLSAQEHSGETPIFTGHGVVHSARPT
jgi:hypothetical protein